MNVTRYFHIRTGDRGGATVKVSGDTERVGQVDVQVVFVSKKDAYCKRTGRLEVEKKPVKVVPLRFLPQELHRIRAKADNFDAYGYDSSASWNFAVRYFLPKE